MTEILQSLFQRAGTYEGFGINHEKQKYRSTLSLFPQVEGQGLALECLAVGEEGTIFHKEHSLLGRNLEGQLALWVMSCNHPGVMEHLLVSEPTTLGAEQTLAFRFGDLAAKETFRETVTLDLWPNGDITYRYAWGMPGGEYQERSSARMLAGKNRPIPEAKMKSTENGLVPDSPGWYVLNAKETPWHNNERFGESCGFEGLERFTQYGINLHWILPGQPSCHYHGEDDQEDFLILKGQCRLLIEGQERLLKEWDFVHCPKWTRHVFVGVGSEPCLAVMVGGRTGHGVTYPVIELAKKYGACPEKETDSPKESYAQVPKWSVGSPSKKI